jgi:pantetheine-phosphate adenylyltransferase
LTKKFDVVATGGTFDEIHLGHIALLRKAFEIGSKVIIGVSSDQFALKRGKHPNNTYEARVDALRSTIKREFGDVTYQIKRLEADFGPAVTEGDIDALVASTETQNKINTLNETRAKKGLKPLQLVSVNLLRAEDGGILSSTRIRAGEIDRTGKVLRTRESQHL